MANKTLFLLAGEASGDLHGSKLIEALRQHPQVGTITGIGGKKMEEQGLRSLFPFSAFQVMGFTEVLKAYPRLRKLFYATADKILAMQPDAVITIDYPGFNLRLAAYLKKKGFKGRLVHYISPTVWAWGKGRIGQMENSFDLLLTVFPFEKDFFCESRLRVEYVGNPLVETIAAKTYTPNWRALAGIPEKVPLLALFPGSRKEEIKKNLPLQLAASKYLMANHPDLHTVISLQDLSFMPHDPRYHLLPSSYTYECMKECKGAIAKSGTVTLELALHKTPAVVTYPVGWLNYMLAKYLFRIRLPHFCISNILLNDTLYPEWIGRKLDPEKIAGSLQSVWDHGFSSAQAEKIRHLLGEKQASREAAQQIMELIC